MATPEQENTPDAPQPNSMVYSRLINAASYMLQQTGAMHEWSGSLDWSKRLVNDGILQDPRLVRAFGQVRRYDFLPDKVKDDEGYDTPIEIGYGQTISQPSLIAEMLERLDPKEGNAVLEVGAGSGWVTGLLASAVGKNGRVVGTEIIPELVEMASQNLNSYDFSWASVVNTGNKLGYAEEAPYNRIIVSGYVMEEWMVELFAQLSPRGGKLIAPIGSAESTPNKFDQHLAVVTRNGSNKEIEVIRKNVGFVPIIYDEDQKGMET